MFSSFILSTFIKAQILREMQTLHQVQLIPPVSITVEGFKSSEI